MAPTAAASTVQRYRWTRADYDRVIETGGFGPDDRIELLDGDLWAMTPTGSLHSTAVLLVQKALRDTLASDFHVRGEQPVAIDDVSQPQPDISVVDGDIRDYAHKHPDTALLLVEVSDSTLSHDRGAKLVVYARNKIPEYWLLDLKASCLDVYREPSGTTYLSRITLTVRDTVAPLCDPDANIAIADLLP